CGAAAAALAFAQMGPLLSARSCTRPETSATASDAAHTGSLLPVKSTCRLDVSASSCGISRLGSLPPACDASHLGPPLVLQSSARSEVLVSVFLSAAPDPPPSSRGFS
ncbi:unnamed protein product, partial [Symbiodinium microadriaticum]